MPMDMTPDDVRRITALAGKLGSDHDGEVIAVSRQLRRLAADRDLSMPELLATAGCNGHAAEPKPKPAPEPGPEPLWSRPTSLQDGLRQALDFPQHLTEWELVFAGDVWLRDWLTDRQRQVAQRILSKVHAAETGERVSPEDWA